MGVIVYGGRIAAADIDRIECGLEIERYIRVWQVQQDGNCWQRVAQVAVPDFGEIIATVSAKDNYASCISPEAIRASTVSSEPFTIV
jgi:hypothetical protein